MLFNIIGFTSMSADSHIWSILTKPDIIFLSGLSAFSACSSVFALCWSSFWRKRSHQTKAKRYLSSFSNSLEALQKSINNIIRMFASGSGSIFYSVEGERITQLWWSKRQNEGRLISSKEEVKIKVKKKMSFYSRKQLYKAWRIQKISNKKAEIKGIK